MQKKPTEKRIVVVDDDPLINEAISKLLSDAGYTVATMTDSTKAMEAIFHIKPDLVILDVAMPDVDGIELARQLQENPKTAPIPIVFLSAVSGTDVRLNTYKSGGTIFIAKPFEQQTVLTIVDAVLRRRAT
jgi:putative two-component system response regulator